MTALGTAARVVDCEHKTAPLSPGGGYFAVGTPAMRGNSINYAEAREIDRLTFDTWTRRLVPRVGDLLFAREAPVGPVVRVPSAANVAPGQRTVLIRPVEDVARSDFLFYLLASPRMQRLIGSLSAGSTVPHLNVADVRELDLGDLPSLSVQQAIGEVLTALDDRIAANRRALDASDELLRVLFSKRASEQPRLAVQSVAAIVLGGTPSRAKEDYWNGDVPWINSGACNMRFVIKPSEFISSQGLKSSAAKLMPRGTTAIAITGATLGQMGWLATEMSANQSVVGVISEEPLRAWLYYALRSEKRQLLEWSTGGAQQHVNKDAVGSLLVPFDVNAGKDFGDVAAPLIAGIEVRLRENVRLEATRDDLLPLLLNGSITVKDAERRVEKEV